MSSAGAPAAEDPLDARLRAVEEELTRAAGGASLCAISRSSGSVPAAKYLEGRLAAVAEVRRAVRRGEEPIAAARSVRERWHEAHDAGLAREPGPDWRAYWAGGVDEADELVDSLTAG